MSDITADPADIERLARLIEKHDLTELRYEDGDIRITLRTTLPVATAPAAPITYVPMGAAPAVPALVAAPNPRKAAPAGTPIPAPIMGVFYRSSKPGEPAFVEVGDTIEVGQTIGMIEAMKVFSEVPSEVAGKVIAIPTENGALVQPGDPLVLVEPAA